MSGQPKRSFDYVASDDFGSWTNPIATSEPLTRSDSLQSLNSRTNNLGIGSSKNGGRPVPAAPAVGTKRKKVEVIELSDDSSDSDDSDIEIIEPPKLNKGKERERLDLGPWWDDNVMKKRREQFLSVPYPLSLYCAEL
jgi:hypothetical protein